MSAHTLTMESNDKVAELPVFAQVRAQKGKRIYPWRKNGKLYDATVKSKKPDKENK